MPDVRKKGALRFEVSPFLLFCYDYFEELTTLRPNGIRATAASLKCCFPNGMPMIVIKKKSPRMACSRPSQMPPMRNHSTFMPVLRHPVACSVLFTSLPNGQRARPANLIIFHPKGIPMMVRHSRRPEKRYPRARNSPPKRTQIMFPKTFIIVVN